MYFRIEADLRKQLGNSGFMVLLAIDSVDLKRLGHEGKNAHSWIQAGIRVLKNDLHLSPKLLHFRERQVDDARSLEDDLTACGFMQANKASSYRRFAATRFAHKPERFAPKEVK
jgi:hypothetical protein